MAAPNDVIACPNRCESGSVLRDGVEEHLKMYPLEQIKCEYHVVGCEETMACKDQKKHNKENTCFYHLLEHNLAGSQVEAFKSREELTAKVT